MEQLQVKKLSPHAILPCRATGGSAGYDLYACLDQPLVLFPGERGKVGTGIAIGIADNSAAAFIYARSGLAARHGIVPANCVGVVDSDYRGEVIVPLFNSGRQSFTINPGDRIAQMVIAPVLLPELCEVQTLEETVRDSGGFGSTGR